ncbi:MAG: anti-sigma factor, partial [Rhizobiaceae bacterium]
MNETGTVVLNDLDAYVDNQLDAAGRLRVENYLSSHPEDAARV